MTESRFHKRRRQKATSKIIWLLPDDIYQTLKEISPEYSLEGLMPKLKFQYLATWCEELTYWKRSWCWERVKAGGEGNNRGWDGWMASLTQWAWVWASSRIWWWTGKTGVLQSTGSQRAGHDWVTELNQIYTIRDIFLLILFLNKQFVYFNELCLFNLFLYCGDFCFLFKTSWPPQGWEGIFCFY